MKTQLIPDLDPNKSTVLFWFHFELSNGSEVANIYARKNTVPQAFAYYCFLLKNLSVKITPFEERTTLKMSQQQQHMNQQQQMNGQIKASAPSHNAQPVIYTQPVAYQQPTYRTSTALLSNYDTKEENDAKVLLIVGLFVGIVWLVCFFKYKKSVNPRAQAFARTAGILFFVQVLLSFTLLGVVVSVNMSWPLSQSDDISN